MMLKMQSDLKDAKAIEDKAKAAEESLRKAIDLKEKLDATASSSVTTTSTAQLASSSTMAKAQVNMDTEMAITRTLIEGAGTIETQVVDEEESTPLQREETANPTEDANGTSTKKRKHAPPDFDVMFKKLSDYCEENSHVNVPQNHPELGEWVKELRKKKSRYEMSDSKRPRTKKPRHRSLTEEQIELLNRLGFSWRINATWEERLAQLQSFHAINGHFKVPRIRGNGLGEWLNDQLKLFRQNNLHFMQTKLPRMEDIGYKCK